MKKQNQIKILMVIVIVAILSFSGFGFAAETGDEPYIHMFLSIGWFLNVIVSFLSWCWVIFAKFAGEFLTNKWVYGEIIGLDQLLWKYWVIVRNIANFGLGFYFVYTIFIAFIKERDIAKKVKDMLKWILVGGIGIQASWFFTAAMIDISTITLSAVGGLPAQVISQSQKVEENMHSSLTYFTNENFEGVRGMRLELIPSNGNKLLETSDYPLQSSVSKAQFIDARLPSRDGEFGPLYYIGLAILKTNKISEPDFSSLNGVKRTILNTIIVGGTTIVYSIEMFVLCVLALIRIVYLWMFIILSPLAVLFRCIGKSNSKDGDKMGGFLGSLNKQINFKTFFINVFKPTIIVLGLGIALIFSILMTGIVNDSGGQVDLGGLQIVSEEKNEASGVTYESVYDTTISGDFFTFTLRNTVKSLLEMIISILTVILVYFIIKISVGIGKSDDFVSKTVNSLQGHVEELMKSVPIIPVKGYDKNGAVNPDSGLSRNSLKALPTRKVNKMREASDSVMASQIDEVMAGLGFADKKSITATQENKFKQIRQNDRNTNNGVVTFNTIKNRKQEVNAIKTEEGYGFKLDKPNIRSDEFTAWLNEVDPSQLSRESKWQDMVQDWKNLGEGEKTLEGLFDKTSRKSNHVKTYANFFELGDVSDWNSLKEKDISKKE